jgi:predicted aconitase
LQRQQQFCYQGEKHVKLTDEEKRMLDGEFGEAVRYSMDILVKLGDLYGAEDFAPIQSVHGAMSYPNFWASVELVESFSKRGAKFRVPTTLNTAAWPGNFKRWSNLPESAEHMERCQRMINAVREMGAHLTCSCTPYFQGNLPRFRECVAWTESSAISFANSVIGARANRITDGIDKAAGVAGRIPRFGLMLDENRKGNALVHIEYKPKNFSDYGTLGWIVGKHLGNQIPVIEGLPESTTTNDFKIFGGAGASSGGMPLYHCVGLTPEAPTREYALGGKKPLYELKIGAKEVKEAEAMISSAKTDKFEAVFFGCPHPTIMELRDIADLLKGKRVKPGIQFWIFLSADVLALARDFGYAQVIEASGAELVERSCVLFFDISKWGWKTILTNSAKYANLLTSDPTWLEAIFRDTRTCVAMATE